MNVQAWVTNTGSQALQKLAALNMDKLTAGLTTPSHLPQQPLVQKLEVSAAQAGCLLAYTLCLTLWFYTELLTHRRRRHYDKLEHMEEGAGKQGQVTPISTGEPHANGRAYSQEPAASYLTLHSLMNCGIVKCLQLDPQALIEAKDALKYCVEFGTIMLWFYMADRSTLLFPVEKEYLRDRFAFIFLVLLIVAGWTSTTKCKVASLLNRQQTEEWKGWMQVLFLLYHYFAAAEMYNAIRVYIAAYVWMTGFGNFLYYYKTNDFSLPRFCQMMWRLNFLVLFCCVVLRNDYMLYYICPMHTLFTIGVYAALGIANSMNKYSAGIAFKIAASLATIFIFWDLKWVFYTVWSPFTWLVGYVDPRKPSNDVLHEWYFRSSLDRYVWIFGMLCAWAHPKAEELLQRIDKLTFHMRWLVRAVLLAVTAFVFYMWYSHIFQQPKLDYNRLHPYTSWIPILCWIVVRNLTPVLRNYSLALFGWLGCITLETYIGQFHTWLHTGVPNGQPKLLLNLFLPGYPLVNFAICTAVYVFVSHRLFFLTNALKNVAIPGKEMGLLWRNGAIMAVSAAALYAAGACVLQSSALMGIR